MGLGPVWVLAEKPVSEPLPSLAALAHTVSNCRACGLCETRTQTVFSAGIANAPLMVIGEAPGADEDAQGAPFVGRAGQLLDRMLHAIGHSRAHNVYIANVLKCRPPNNRNPEPSEVAQCVPFLMQQIELNQPKVVLLLGRFAIHALLNTDQPISQLRGTVHSIALGDRVVPAIASYHPAYLLRRPGEKSKSWDDLRLLGKMLKGG